MKITVMTSDEQILNLDVDPNESVWNHQKYFLFLLFIYFFLLLIFIQPFYVL